jgi:hypothetical protein
VSTATGRVNKMLANQLFDSRRRYGSKSPFTDSKSDDLKTESAHRHTIVAVVKIHKKFR